MMEYSLWSRQSTSMRTVELREEESRLRTELSMRASGWTASEMATALKSGQMDPGTMDTGATIRPTDKASLSMLTETSTRASGSTIKLTAKVLTHMQMEPTTMETGSTISSTDSAWSHGQMAPSTKETTSTARRKAKAN